MSYYKILGLAKEPFSTSPDPSFFYNAKDHKAALYRLRVALSLKRGLNLILGDVGTGKTTLARKLYQMTSPEADYDFHVILNPAFGSEIEFLEKLAESFHVEIPTGSSSATKYLDAIEKKILLRGVEEGKTIVLLIDEAQKMNEGSLEVLRTLLNYETNEFKLLQVILMSQLEILPKIVRLRNLWDRVHLKYMLNPLSRKEMGELIQYRLKQAGYKSRQALFTKEALDLIYQSTQGLPRKVTVLCHNSLEHLVMDNKDVVERKIVQDILSQEEMILHMAQEQELGLARCE